MFKCLKKGSTNHKSTNEIVYDDEGHKQTQTNKMTTKQEDQPNKHDKKDE